MTVRRVTSRHSTVPALLAAVADAYGDREAFVDPASSVRLTFGEWERCAAGLAAHWAELGVGKGDVVSLILPSSADYAICYQAALRLGAVTTGVNPRFGPAEQAHILNLTEPKVVVRSPDEVRPHYGNDPIPVAPGLDPTDPVAIVWTSGTTGRPKGAVFDTDNLVAMSEGAGALSMPGDRRLAPVPFAHVAYMCRVWDELANVITSVIVPTPWRASTAVELIVKERVTVVQGVPTQWRLMLEDPSLEGADTSSVRLAAIGAAPATPELVRRIRERFEVPVINRYASTEASIISGTRPGDGDDKVATTVGRPCDGVAVRICDDAGRPVPPGREGVIQCRSGAMMRGYWRDPDGTRAAFTADGWLVTGDVGRLDEDGFLTIVGRRSDVYIRGGYNVYPAEVEACLAEHPAVARVAVVGVPDPVLGEIGHAFVVVRPGATLALEDVRAWVRERLADYKAPDRLHVVDDLPLTSMDKVDKGRLLQLAAGS
jgi:acyl-CoA synthetase (AMP-forming)/AMP-acid ligase II